MNSLRPVAGFKPMSCACALLPFLICGLVLQSGEALANSAVGAAEKVQVPSQDLRAGQALPLLGHWFPAASSNSANTRAPAIVLLHGCGGAYGRRGELSERMKDYSQVLNAEGWHVLVLDSLTPRGERELCTQKIGTRAITMTERRRDALGALQWLAARPDVDASRLALLGWSNGGSTVLASTNLNHAEVKAAALRPRAAVAFYPGCEADQKRGYAPSAPLLMLTGAADDWTPSAPCEALAREAQPSSGIAQPKSVSYAGAFHGFDAKTPVRLRADVPNGVKPGAGVHVGGQAEALARSRVALLDFLREQLRNQP
ncbi:dienelactone hydrolase family protein [Roseateles sp.]|uniref:dienelactone hydrolase family protein n=1 Tax=Roseateles sp. TaxID=1971397 RepID=UPI003BA82C93